MDHMMPEMDGVEATRIIREEIGTDYAKNVTIIALTANSILGNEEMFLSSGFQAFLSKPVDMIKLDAILNTWVRNREQEKPLSFCAKSQNPQQARSNAVIERLNDIPGYNAGEALDKFAGDTDSLISVINSFRANTPLLLDELKAVNQNALQKYAITIHGIKGSSRSIGAEDVGRDAEALEDAAKKGDAAFVSENNAAFIDKTIRLIDALGGALEEIVSTDRGRRPVPDKKLLGTIGAAAAVFDIDKAEEALSQLETYDYEEGGELVFWLRGELDKGGFCNISERLTK
jgi:CheY-like chemotaxis protein